MQRRRVLAMLAAAAAPGLSASAARATVEIGMSGIAFEEPTAALTVGDVVVWVNHDVVAHTATARNKDFRVVVPEHGKARLVLRKAGTVDFYCEYHPNMTGRLVIRDKTS